ncbi:MAG: hypothetical protein ACOC56_07165 [Atribacterota bacterium]
MIKKNSNSNFKWNNAIDLFFDKEDKVSDDRFEIPEVNKSKDIEFFLDKKLEVVYTVSPMDKEDHWICGTVRWIKKESGKFLISICHDDDGSYNAYQNFDLLIFKKIPKEIELKK